jgi:SAM-dependent methyltransferase
LHRAFASPTSIDDLATGGLGRGGESSSGTVRCNGSRGLARLKFSDRPCPVLEWGVGDREEYYVRRAPEYDETITVGLDAEAIAAWEQELAAVGHMLAALTEGRVLDVACGTGLFTRFLRGRVVTLDNSSSMLEAAHRRAPAAWLVQARVPALPFPSMAFDRLLTTHFYGHLVEPERLMFLGEARRLASELVVVDSAASATTPADGWERRVLLDGSPFTIYKRHFTPAQLLAELIDDVHDGEVLFTGHFFVAVRSQATVGGTEGYLSTQRPSRESSTEWQPSEIR